jgi:hypothetical protein
VRLDRAPALAGQGGQSPDRDLPPVNKGRLAAHHDAVEFPDGRTVLLTLLCEGQQATVLQLPVQAKTPEEAAKQQRTAYAG